jgi:hypothetical protein
VQSALFVTHLAIALVITFLSINSEHKFRTSIM